MEEPGKGSCIRVSNIPHNLAVVRAQIAQAVQRAGRKPEDVRLIAVTKTRPLADLEAIVAAGVQDLGENRVQEALPKAEALAGLPAVWHLIGSLQTNKVRQALQFAQFIHSVDRPELLAEISKQAGKLQRTVEVLLQVNVSGEASKHGVAPDGLRPLLEAAAQAPNIAVRGLMTMAPASDNPEEARPTFAGLRELAERITTWQLPAVEMKYLSMGMSGDFTVAVEEGANLIRIGTALFGDRL